MEQRIIYDKISVTQESGFEPSSIAFTYADMPDTPTHPIQAYLREVRPEYMRCPSSPLPVTENEDGPILMPSYVGISGGCDIDPQSADFDGCPNKPESQRLYKNSKKGTGPNGSIVTSSGLLPPNEQISISMCTDGTSNVMIVAEQSDWLRDIGPNVKNKYHGDPGWNPPSDRNPGGWLSGTDVVDPVGKAVGLPDASKPGDWHADLLLNITTVRFKPDLKIAFEGDGRNLLPGCGPVMGHDNPLQSPHPGGLQVALLDGSVQFISGTVDLAVLLRLAIRDDGQNVDFD